MRTSLLTRALLPLLFACDSFAGVPPHVVNFCNQIGGLAAGISLYPGPALTTQELEAEAALISTKTAFEYEDTKSMVFEIANDPSRKNLSAAEFAGTRFFWCVYDLVQIPAGSENAFAFQQDAIDLYQTTIKHK